ncbi:MAG: hypothetical protein LBG06_03165 [Deltaproteobacteria bacterium]|nr:hypothetical protein [Deltaproteobacteria bacterium]
MLKKILLAFLLFFLAVGSGLGLLLLAWFQQWSPWIALLGPAVFLLLPFFWYLGTLVQSVLARRRYAETVLGRGGALPAGAREDSPLRMDWDRGILSLRPPGRSLPKDPVRSFPWFLAAGPPGAGRHGFLRGAGPPLDPDPAAPLEGGEGCSWYFCDCAVYLAVRGLYEVSHEGGAQGGPQPLAGLTGSLPGAAGAAGPPAAGPGGVKDTRAALCSLLRETGRRVPLQGVLAAVPAELLRLEREAELRDLALQTGLLLDRLAEDLDIAPPVYLFLTGLHLEPGWGAALERLSRQGATAGSLLEGDAGDEGLAAEAAGALRDEVRDLLTETFWEEPAGIAPFLPAPAAAEGLQRPLAVFCGALRSQSHDRGAPTRIGGIFVSLPPAPAAAKPRGAGGAAPGGGPPAGAQGKGGHAGGGAALGADGGGPERLLAETLPGLAHLSRRINRQGGARQRVFVRGILAFYLALLCVALLFAKNVDYQRGASEAASRLQVAAAAAGSSGTGELGRADAAMYMLTSLEEYDRSVRLRGLGPDPAGAARARLEGVYEDNLEAVTSEISLAIASQMDEVTDPDSDLFAVTFRQLLYLFAAYSGRLDELTAGTASGEGPDSAFPLLPDGMEALSRPWWNLTYARLLGTRVERAGFRPIRGGRSSDILEELNNAVDRAMELRGDKSFAWLMDWIERSPDVAPVSIASFWAPYFTQADVERALPPGALTAVRGACTAQGRVVILEALNLIEAASNLDRMSVLGDSAREFGREHDVLCLREWDEFELAFSGAVYRSLLGQAGLAAIQELHAGTSGSPGARAAVTILDNLRYLLESTEAPVWLKNLEIGRMSARWSAAKDGWRRARGPLQKIRSVGPMAGVARDQLSNMYYRTDFIKRVFDAEVSFTRYRMSTEEILASLSRNPDEAYRLAARNYGGPGALPPPAPAPGAPPAAPAADADQPFQDAKESLAGYARALYVQEGDSSPDDFVLRMRNNEFEALKVALVETAARTLDHYWESDVLLPVKFLPDSEVQQALYGQQGLLLKFLSGRAAPFLDAKGPAGYSPRVWDGRPFPFTDDFLRLASVGSGALSREPVLDSYSVDITVTAALAGEGAQERPERTVIALKTPEELQALVNYNYPSSRSFTWKPGTAAEASLEIDFPSVSLLVTWEGAEGFPSFLNDLVTHNFLLKPADFPDHRAQLEALGVSQIRVLMKADGALPVINFLNLTRTPLPVSIVGTI